MADIKIEMPQEEVDEIIRNKRKARDPKACYACHRRKVKCDRGSPCESCIKRDHPELCSYERPSKRRQLAINRRLSELERPDRAKSPSYSPTSPHDSLTSPPGATISVSKDQWDKMNQELRTMQETINNLSLGMDSTPVDENPVGEWDGAKADDNEREGIHARSGILGTMHLGSRSVLAYMMGLGRKNSNQEVPTTLLQENVLPKLGLDNETSIYPFVDLWSSDASAWDVSALCKTLPDDDLCREFFSYYRDVACTIYPVISDTIAFENKLNILLQNRSFAGGDYVPTDEINDKPFGVTLSWLALLFAVLASGCQSSDRPPKERVLTSQVYICCSYQALRMTNFMSQPSLETIQCFLIIGNVLSYNMNPGVAYILLGMALRMAFTLGLQTDSHQFSGHQQYLRRRVWWALAWQDSHFSMSYDRPSCSALYGPEIPYRTPKPGLRTYAESMFRIIQLTQEIIKGRMIKPDANLTWGAIRSYKEEITRIVAEGAPHLRERNNCTSKTQHLERVALKLHSSYITSELCRPALKEQDTCETDERRSSLPTSVSHSQRSQNHSMSPTQTAATTLESLTTQLRRECIANLVLTIDAYLEAHSISQHAARSWIGIQRAISAAFLLGITQESHYDQQIRNLLRNLETVISEKTKMDSNFFDPTGFQSPAVGHAPTNTYGDVDGGSQGRFNSLTCAPGLGDSTNEAIPPKSPRWPRPMNQSLKALSKLNGALATPRPGSVTHLPPAFPPSAMNPGSVVGMDQLWSGQFSPGNPALVMPATPESSGSGEWNYGNLGERAAEYVQPALWG